MQHLSNIYDPRKKDAKMLYMTYSFHAQSDAGQMEREWQQHLQWVHKNSIGIPKATDSYTVEQLVSMGMVGIYKA